MNNSIETRMKNPEILGTVAAITTIIWVLFQFVRSGDYYSPVYMLIHLALFIIAVGSYAATVYFSGRKNWLRGAQLFVAFMLIKVVVLGFWDLPFFALSWISSELIAILAGSFLAVRLHPQGATFIQGILQQSGGIQKVDREGKRRESKSEKKGERSMAKQSKSTSGGPTIVIMNESGGSGGPNIIVRAVWYIFIGWWLSLSAIFIAYFLCLTIIGLPLGFAIFNRLPAIITLRSRTKKTGVTTVDGVVYISGGKVPQLAMWIRALWFIFVGWWVGAIYLAIAWFLCLTILGLPLGLYMFNRVGSVMTLLKY
jgi:uncharacterized membrane protein YccF (DUF307 family)